MISGRASARDRIGRPGNSMFHGDMAGRGIDHKTRHGERMYARLVFRVNRIIAVVERGLATDTRTDDRSRALTGFTIERNAGIGNRFTCRNKPELGKPVQNAQFPLVEIIGGFETGDFRTDLNI